MTYHRRNIRKINKKVVAIIVILLLLFFFGSSIKSLVHMASVPINTTKNILVTPFKSSIEYFKTKKSLIDENEELKNQNRRLSIENLTIESLKRENSSLKEIVDFNDETQDFFVAKVINQPPFSPYDTFVVNIGSSDISIGDRVDNFGVAIGEIEEVYSRSAIVRLYSSPNKNIFVKLAEQEFEAVGIGGGGFSITIPKDVQIETDEPVFLNENPIGVVDAIENDQTGAFKKVYFRYPFNVNDVNFVQIYKI